ncbi:amidohydrolase [Salisediminibacterium beveridgei]|uniref:Putative amidohydrolase yhaA n=1 Tax=Salisediminibacterium beveridgei TaxID=632773 RepID=A0A1D7QTW7_9BACI|nr:Putative amidohydrolase yhaA [Salisediminibacterium beveridgei]
MAIQDQLHQALENHFEEMVDIRRYLHERPELSFHEEHTPAYIANYHEDLGHEVKTGVGGRGVTAVLEGAQEGPTIALRADFDALPIHDLKDVPYRSKVDGVMHACGHDAHTAELLVLAKVLNHFKSKLKGKVVFLHQFAEEVAPGGAKPMIEDGCLDGVDVVYGTHLWSTTPVCEIEYQKEAAMAAADRFIIRIQGEGGHGAHPHTTRDAVLIGAKITDAIHHIVSRTVDPMESAVISIGRFEAVNAFNVISDSAELEGTVRTFKPAVQELIRKEMERITRHIAAAYGAEATFEFIPGYPAVINHPEHAEIVRRIADSTPSVAKVTHVAPQMGGEDFGYYLQEKPGAFFFTGAKNPEWPVAYPQHHPKFDIDEKAMLTASNTLGNLVFETMGIR